jgi:chromosome segregation ATPase
LNPQVKPGLNIDLEVVKMKRIIILTVTVITLVGLPECIAATSQPADGNAVRTPITETPLMVKPKPRVNVVTMADFYLRDGNTISGRVLSDDSSQIVIEQPSESTLVTKTYSRREIDARTLRKRTMPEWNYYTQLGEYFAAQTWDFKDDPDDFIQAIRCYEKAKQSLQESGAEPDKQAEIDKAIKKLQGDRDVWTKEVESRAKLKELEYKAEAENRLKQLEKQITESTVKLNESVKYLDKASQDIKNDYKNMEKTISELNKDFVKQINDLQVQIQDNRTAINQIATGLYWMGRPPAGGGK